MKWNNLFVSGSILLKPLLVIYNFQYSEFELILWNTPNFMKDNEHFSNKDIDAINCDNSENYFMPVMDEIFNIISVPNTVLDVGCGNGLFTSLIKDKFSCKVTGVDGSEYALLQASKLEIDKLIKIIDFSNDALPFDNEEFDFVICKDVLEHLVNPKHCIDEIYRVTKKSGHVLIHVPNHFPIIGRLKFLFTNNIDTFNYFPDAQRWNFPHIRFFTKKSVIDLCRGFSIAGQFDHFFIRIPFFHRLIPATIKKNISKRYTDELCEGYTILFKKVQG